MDGDAKSTCRMVQVKHAHDTNRTRVSNEFRDLPELYRGLCPFQTVHYLIGMTCLNFTVGSAHRP